MSIPAYSKRNAFFTFLLILLLAGLLRYWLIQSDSIRFSSDEAIVGLMARHILQGKPIPTFFYSQHYLSSLDALVVAGGFVLFGESVKSLRLAQLALYLLVIWTGYLMAYEVSRRQRVALMVALLLAIPTMLGTTYTSTALSGHNETLIFSNLVFLLGWRVTIHHSEKVWHWALLGLSMGLGWWNYGAIITPIAVTGILGLRYFSFSKWYLYLLAAIFFMVGSSPWWVYNLNHEWAALGVLMGADHSEVLNPIPFTSKLTVFFLLGLPSLYGIRLPWNIEVHYTLLTGLAVLVYWVLVTDALAHGWAYLCSYKFSGWKLEITPIRWIWIAILFIGITYLASPFQDISGRYFLPVWIPAFMGVSFGLLRLERRGWFISVLGFSLLLAFNAGEAIKATRSEIGVEYQEVDYLRVPKGDDEALIEFLKENNYTRGYTTYWVAYHIIFMAGEEIIFDVTLPDDHKGYKTGQNRYTPYIDIVAAADEVVWITQANPPLDRTIAYLLEENGIKYRTKDLGVYRVYYDFSERVSPRQFGLHIPRTAHELMVQHGGAEP